MGIQVSQSDGYAYTSGSGVMAGYNWGFPNQNLLSPRLIVTDASAEVLGRYQSDNQISSARKRNQKYEAISEGFVAEGPGFEPRLTESES